MMRQGEGKVSAARGAKFWKDGGSKGLVMVTQGDGDRPAAASRRQTLGKKYRTTTVISRDVFTNPVRL